MQKGQSHPTSRRQRVSLVRLIISLVLLGLAVWVLFNRQFLIDQYTLYRYEPTDRIESLADDTTMTDLGRRYFFASAPEINDAEEFNQNCGASEERSIILGCYTRQQIFLYDIQDERLPRVMEVTAAHEMLHAAYARLGASEKTRIDGLVSSELEANKDQRIDDLAALYNRTEPGELLNEMHSIFATEVRDISPELEEYYKQYFTDRKQIVTFSEGYEQVFTEISNRQDALSAELSSLQAEIARRNEAYSAGVSQLNTDINNFNRRANDGSFSSQSQFNEERNGLVARQNALQAEREAINDLVARFNAIRQELLDLNLRVQSLNDSLDSTPEAPTEDVPQVR